MPEISLDDLVRTMKKQALTLPGDTALAGDTAELIKKNALETPRNSAVFWSNDFRVDDKTGKFGPVNKRLAEELAAGEDYVIIREKAPLVDKMWAKDFTAEGKPVSPGAKTMTSAALSEDFARRASGTVTVFAQYTGATSFFRAKELPALMANEKVDKVASPEPKGEKLSPAALKQEWYDRQRGQWVQGRIEKLNALNETWAKKAAPGDYAVTDFGHELAHAYRNRAQKDGPSYIDPAKEKGYTGTLQKALRDTKNPELQAAVAAFTEKQLASDPMALALFQADMAAAAEIEKPGKAAASAIQVAAQGVPRGPSSFSR